MRTTYTFNHASGVLLSVQKNTSVRWRFDRPSPTIQSIKGALGPLESRISTRYRYLSTRVRVLDSSLLGLFVVLPTLQSSVDILQDDISTINVRDLTRRVP